MDAETFERHDAKHGLSVARGTTAVPDDGCYHVLVRGEIVFSSKVEAAALIIFEERREAARAASADTLRREAAANDVRAFRRQSYADKASRDGKKGGRGVGRK